MKLEIYKDNVKVNEITNQLDVIMSYCEALQNKYINKGNVKLHYDYNYKNNECMARLTEKFENGVTYVYIDIPCQAFLLDRFKIEVMIKEECKHALIKSLEA